MFVCALLLAGYLCVCGGGVGWLWMCLYLRVWWLCWLGMRLVGDADHNLWNDKGQPPYPHIATVATPHLCAHTCIYYLIPSPYTLFSAGQQGMHPSSRSRCLLWQCAHTHTPPRTHTHPRTRILFSAGQQGTYPSTRSRWLLAQAQTSRAQPRSLAQWTRPPALLTTGTQLHHGRPLQLSHGQHLLQQQQCPKQKLRSPGERQLRSSRLLSAQVMVQQQGRSSSNSSSSSS